MTRLAVTGGRHYANAAAVASALDRYQIAELAHGDADGLDDLAERYAIDRGIPNVRFQADWRRHGRAAGPIRNGTMLREFRPDVLVAFPGGGGTADCVRQARKLGIAVVEVEA